MNIKMNGHLECANEPFQRVRWTYIKFRREKQSLELHIDNYIRLNCTFEQLENKKGEKKIDIAKVINLLFLHELIEVEITFSMEDTNLKDSKLWKKYRYAPVPKSEIRLKYIHSEKVRVGFDKDCTIMIFFQSLEEYEETKILNYSAEILAQYFLLYVQQEIKDILFVKDKKIQKRVPIKNLARKDKQKTVIKEEGKIPLTS